MQKSLSMHAAKLHKSGLVLFTYPPSCVAVCGVAFRFYKLPVGGNKISMINYFWILILFQLLDPIDKEKDNTIFTE